ncbi:MAG: hypothetical protein ABIQ99_16010 [Thermoflexales bacterium]
MSYKALRASAEALLCGELATRGWAKRRGITTRKIDGRAELWLALGMTSYGTSALPVIGIWPLIGIRHLQIEAIERSVWSNESQNPLAAVRIGVAYLLEPEHSGHWLVTTNNLLEECASMVDAIETVAPRFAADHASLDRLIIDLQEGRRVSSQDSKRDRLPIALYAAGRYDEARDALKRGANEYRGATHAGAVRYREFRRRMLALIKSGEDSKPAMPKWREWT